jgi:capsular exopolysaccharide synthesis family protein
MDTPERPESTPERSPYLPPAPLPPPSRAPSPLPPPAPAWEEPMAAEAEPAGRAFNPKVIWQAFRRHWWQILLLWAAGSATLVTLIYYKVKPTFQATAMIQIEPNNRGLTAPVFNRADLGPYLKTQALLVTSPDVLSAALQDPSVQNTAMLRGSLDPEAALRSGLKAVIEEDSQIFSVTLASENPAEGATIVNAVVEAYKKATDAWASQEMQSQVERLRELGKGYRDSYERHQNKLRELYGKQGGQEAAQQLRSQIVEGGEPPVTYTQLARFAEERTRAEMQSITDENQLAYLRGDLASREAAARAELAARPPEVLDEEIRRAFLTVPAVARVVSDLEAAETQLEAVGRPARNPQNDPAYRYAARRVEQLKAQYDDYWRQLYPSIRAQVATMPEETRRDLAELKSQVESMEAKVHQDKIQEDLIRRRLSELQLESQSINDLSFEIEMERSELQHAKSLLDVVEKNLEQLEYERRGTATIDVVAWAKPVGQQGTNNRTKLVLAAPVGMLGLILGLFTLLEMRAARVADPEDLPSRVRLGVLGVVPPLPAPSGGGRGLRRGDDRRRVEEFVQSLDHLRVALYADRPDGTSRRCILITSAVGGEGKTTLAAQLAGRCANAGLLTVLVDADLRRPSLGDLLEVPEGPGLSDVLAGEVDPEAAMVVIGNAGGFHLLPAGAPGRDPSRLLHGERLGELIAQLRATFDVVIVDAPPVLAVPDALLLGRWTDGAVLAVRHDSSRFPLVERANRRLAAVSIPVLGAVVNGCRTMETNYGAYQYNAYSGRGAEGGA